MRLSVLAFIVTLSISVPKYDAFSSSTNTDKSRVTPLISDIEDSANVPAELSSGWKAQDSQYRRLKLFDQLNPADHSKVAAQSIGEEDTAGVKDKLPQLETEPPRFENEQRKLANGNIHESDFAAFEKPEYLKRLRRRHRRDHLLRHFRYVTDIEWRWPKFAKTLWAKLKKRVEPIKVKPM
ncbi:hypothetical protein Plhal703r1_c20g0090521 [Plasmopara halstedii]